MSDKSLDLFADDGSSRRREPGEMDSTPAATVGKFSLGQEWVSLVTGGDGADIPVIGAGGDVWPKGNEKDSRAK